jgi:malonyl-CoA/methylmalonyl-CoA synthetase
MELSCYWIYAHTLLLSYLFDEAATIAAHDEEGWFRTGDICRREGPYIFIVGRASVDIIKSGGYKIGAPEVERACLELSYVQEVAVMGVDDEEFGQRVAAIVSRPSKSGSNDLSITRLRDDLRKLLPAYKLPTLLRLVQGELPKSQTGKVQKTTLRPLLFPPSWEKDPEIQVWRPMKARL